MVQLSNGVWHGFPDISHIIVNDGTLEFYGVEIVSGQAVPPRKRNIFSIMMVKLSSTVFQILRIVTLILLRGLIKSNHSTESKLFIYSKTCPYRNALGTNFHSGLDRFRFRQGFCFWRGTDNDNLYN